MKQRGTVAILVWLLFACSFAGGVAKESVRVKVLDSETHSVVIDDSGVPKNCDPVNFDAYCHNSRTSLVTNTLLLQQGTLPPFRVACTIESRWSRCIPLPKGETFDAKRSKHGLTIYYIDDNGKARSQMYTLVAQASEKGKPQLAARAPAADAQNTPPAAPAVTGVNNTPSAVKCSFTSTPAGAEITVDGKYVGNTPSEVALSTGDHVVVFSLAGFAPWKRDLTVMPSSDLSVSAVLQKQ